MNLIKLKENFLNYHLIYLASPYTTKDLYLREQRFLDAEYATAILLKSKFYVYSPIVHCHKLSLSYSLPGDIKFWENYCINTLTYCTHLFVLELTGWEQSEGVNLEMKTAKHSGIPIIRISLQDIANLEGEIATKEKAIPKCLTREKIVQELDVVK
jgi:hypothetical protein